MKSEADDEADTMTPETRHPVVKVRMEGTEADRSFMLTSKSATRS